MNNASKGALLAAAAAAMLLSGCATNGGAPGLNCRKPVVHATCKGVSSCKGVAGDHHK